MSWTTTEQTSTRKPLSVFISYAHEDERYRLELGQHLGFLQHSGQLVLWHDRMLVTGDPWEHRIAEELERSNLILLLVSPAFADSDYCWGVETKRALERHQLGEATIVPILIRPVAGWADTPIGRLQALPRDAKPVSTWPNPDEAYVSIAEGLRHLMRQSFREATNNEIEWPTWSLSVEGEPADYPLVRREDLAIRLRKAANSEKLECVGVSAGSARILFRSPQVVMDAVANLHSAGSLSQMAGTTVLGISKDTGAVLRVESRIVDREYRSTTHYLPEMFGGRTLEEGFPPLVGGISFPLTNPMALGFSLLTDAAHEMPTAAEQQELQSRLGRYLNTFLVLSGEHVNVTLTPTDDYCGLPPLLRHTELGRDLLAQDVVLKHYTAAQLHPSTERGKAFWERVNALPSGRSNFESCFRVWIVPGDASIREETVGDNGEVTIEKLGLKVLCEHDYETLRQYRTSLGARSLTSWSPEAGEEIIRFFKELIVPEIQKEVSLGPRFGLLRQILSVLLVAKWIMQSSLGEPLTQAGFIGSNAPDKYGLNVVDDAVLNSMKRIYLQMFGRGVWQHTALRFDTQSGLMEKRLFVAGGIELRRDDRVTTQKERRRQSRAAGRDSPEISDLNERERSAFAMAGYWTSWVRSRRKRSRM